MIRWQMEVGVPALAVALLIAGCGEAPPQLVPVTGTVVMDGEALSAGAIIFHPDAGNEYLKDRPSSLLQLDGSFEMKTFPFGPGVPLGKYKVTLAPELATRINHAEYGRLETTPWEIEVTSAGVADHEFEVK